MFSTSLTANIEGVAEDLLNKWLDDFPRDNGRLVAQRACTQFDTMAILANQSKTVSHVFNTKVSIMAYSPSLCIESLILIEN